MNAERATWALQQARREADDAIDALGAAYKRNGSAAYKPLPTWSEFHAAVLELAAFLITDDAS